MIGTTYANRLSTLTQGANQISEQISALQEQATTGLAINRPSDAPEQVSYLHGLSSQLDDQGVWSTNAERATSYLATAESALSGMADLITSARALATQYASETYSEEDRAAGADEAQAILDELVSLANTDLAGRHIFAGTSYDSEPFDSTGGYLGDSGEPTTRISSSQEVAMGFDGSALLQGDTDIFAAVSDLVTALTDNDTDAITAAMGELEDAGGQITSARTEVASGYNMAEDAVELASNMETLLSEAIESSAGADLVSVYTELSELQTSYEAVLQITASTQSMNLFAMM